jgi:hypothetical protein
MGGTAQSLHWVHDGLPRGRVAAPALAGRIPLVTFTP